jgi:uncharacterized membrane protein YeaQ/YmgE (transglycosylase-associated protein family)
MVTCPDCHSAKGSTGLDGQGKTVFQAISRAQMSATRRLVAMRRAGFSDNDISVIVPGDEAKHDPKIALDQAQTNNQTMDQGAGIVAWIVVGLVSGYLASLVINKTGEGTLRDIILGVIGGIVGGILFRAIGGHGVTGFNLGSILVAFIGAVVVLILYLQ